MEEVWSYLSCWVDILEDDKPEVTSFKHKLNTIEGLDIRIKLKEFKDLNFLIIATNTLKF